MTVSGNMLVFSGKRRDTCGKGWTVKKLLIIDDDHDLFSLLERLLTPAGYACFHAPDGLAGLNTFENGVHDAIVLDIMLPGLDGMGVLAEIRKRNQDIPVLMLTACGEEQDLVAGLEAGADDYLAKPFRGKELTARLNALLRKGAKNAPPRHADIVVGDMTVKRSDLSVAVNDAAVAVSPLEYRLVETLAESPGTVVSRQTLYQLLFGRKPYIEDRGLEMLISRLRKKIGPCPDGRERIRAVRGEGYYLTPGGGE